MPIVASKPARAKSKPTTAAEFHVMNLVGLVSSWATRGATRMRAWRHAGPGWWWTGTRKRLCAGAKYD
jgi:hypothetical protein